MNFLRTFLSASVLLLASAAFTENWPSLRGPQFDGSSKETGLPVDFSKTNNVKWAADMPGPSAATPVIWGESVFVSSTDLRTKTLRAIALDRKTGKELWNNEAGAGFNWDNLSNFSSSSPTTDGTAVFFLYGNGDLVALDFNGKKIWSRSIEKDYGQFAYQWTYGASPTLFDGRLYILVLQRNVPVHGRGRKDGPSESYLLALNPKTGKELWKHIRPSDAKQESLEAYSTPLPFTHNGRTEMLITGGDCISGHDPKDGKEFWRWGTWNVTDRTDFRLVPSPVAGEGVALACGPKATPVYAVKLGLKGKLDESALAWVSKDREVSSDVCTPLFYKNKFYVLNGDRKTIARVDPKSGKAEWIGELGTRVKIESSPTGADGKIYFMDHRGDVFIVAAADEFKLLKTISMGDAEGDRLRSSIAVSQGNLFIRTGSKLYCIGK